MRKWIQTAAFTVALATVAAAYVAGPVAAQGLPPGKPIFADMKNENDVAVQQVRDALTAFKGMKKRWPSDLSTLRRFAEENKLPLDLAAFGKANYTLTDSGDTTVALFEFSIKGTQTSGAFALVDHVVK